MKEKKILKIDDSDLESVNGGMIIGAANTNIGARNALFTQNDTASPRTAICGEMDEGSAILLDNNNNVVPGNNLANMNRNQTRGLNFGKNVQKA
ncbi:MAG: hypothetical protein K5668_07310 [Lachnospiraceae bacterium]|nr:hypothetical protein [Lachnospiraceae bacterium]